MKAEAIFFKEHFTASNAMVLQGTFLELKPGTTVPSWLEHAVVRLRKSEIPVDKRISGVVGDDDFVSWLKPTTSDEEVKPSPKLTCAQVRKRFAWSEEQWGVAERYGFPRPAARRMTEFGGPGDGEPLWRESDVNRWADEFATFASSVLEKV